MDIKEITDSNKLITEFMGYKLARCSNGKAWESPFQKAVDDVFKIHGRLFHPVTSPYYNTSNSYLKFNESLDWLKHVINKVARTDVGHYGEPYSSVSIYSPINEMFEATVNFIKWFNENKVT